VVGPNRHADTRDWEDKESEMIREQQPALSLLAIGLIGMGTPSVTSRDFALGWQPVPQFHAVPETLAVVCGLFMITVSVALLFRATVAVASRAVFLFFIAWLCLKVPAVTAAPQIEGVWIGFGEIGILLAGGWVLFARLSDWDSDTFFRHMSGQRGVRMAQIL